MPSDPAEGKGLERNLLLVVTGLLLISAITAGACAYICGFTLDAFQSSNAMVALITNDGVKMDDKTTEAQIASATRSLSFVKDVSWSLVIGCLGMMLAVGHRLTRHRRLEGK